MEDNGCTTIVASISLLIMSVLIIIFYNVVNLDSQSKQFCGLRNESYYTSERIYRDGKAAILVTCYDANKQYKIYESPLF